ncbi:MAG: hypothetical protein HCA25_12315 [Dolichospermum sp. DET50]|nr:hypothetical protein [Dolichospermum sp. DET66]MBS3033036.1 hypothetical protein [Dolichospermum sp. DET67]MBS3038241.1 hypothetical protein [Dolichospermum sp. DET50]QSX70139.1 MAG: hypothetical protein EZY12_11530 [Dolichospermum sp. DET69]
MIIQLPAILPGELNLVEINQKLHQHKIILDWSSVISAPKSQLAILLEGIDLVEDADWLGIDSSAADNATLETIIHLLATNEHCNATLKFELILEML